MSRVALLPLLVLLPGCQLCQVDTGGCGDAAVLFVPPCAVDVEEQRFDEYLTGAPQAGDEVTVWGPLRREAGSCTQLGCAWESACCNSCGAWMGLSDGEGRAWFGVDDLGLLGEVDGVELACGGDESIQCCPLPTDGSELVLAGTMVEFGSSLEGPRWALEVSSICIRG